MNLQDNLDNLKNFAAIKSPKNAMIEQNLNGSIRFSVDGLEVLKMQNGKIYLNDNDISHLPGLTKDLLYNWAKSYCEYVEKEK